MELPSGTERQKCSLPDQPTTFDPPSSSSPSIQPPEIGFRSARSHICPLHKLGSFRSPANPGSPLAPPRKIGFVPRDARYLPNWVRSAPQPTPALPSRHRAKSASFRAMPATSPIGFVPLPSQPPLSLAPPCKIGFVPRDARAYPQATSNRVRSSTAASSNPAATIEGHTCP